MLLRRDGSWGSVEGKDDDGRGAACSKKAIWDCSVASPGFAGLLDELVLRTEVFPFSACFHYFLLFRFWPLLPKEILFFLNGQGKVPSPLDYFLVKTTAYSGSFSCLFPIF